MDKCGKLKLWEAAALVALCLSLCAGTWAQARQSAISGSLIRLHVVAVSDDEAEQALKLEVRDAVLAYLAPRLKGAGDSAAARELISGELEGIAKAAAAASKGREVTVTLGCESFPTRQYEGFTLPAGKYESLRVVLGAGRGNNWWCIVFPPLCLSAAEAEQVQSVMSEDDFALVTESEGYELRFRLVELWGELTAALKGR
ncbi:MAG: stage II sporulation protein R [Oscillospiraceae bacterium]|nr:stage II sporulation protein R [Oscillospiraceae bacterium]